ncbi:MAG: hypothetical protein KC776_08880 [Myxococcales bacterium]|nr:hypothetical protein [Myxococcales bacterium]MCB9578877.1 hypothetical protein [Polyangiaceae bacterium]
MRHALLLVFSTSMLMACGGKSSSDGGGGSGAQAGSGGVGATGGSGGVGATGGSGATGGMAGAGGSAGNECSAELKQNATLGGPEVGFDSLPGSNESGIIQNVSSSALEISFGTVSTLLVFKWVGPDLSDKFTKGEGVGFGEQNGWSYVAGSAWVAAARRDFGFVAQSIPDLPYYPAPQLSYGTECTFKEGGGGCGQPGGTISLLSVDASTGAGVVSAGQGQTIDLLGWQIHNANSAQYPGYGSENCVVEAGFASVITAVGPALDTFN